MTTRRYQFSANQHLPTSRRGSIIVFVLVFIVLLTFIVTAFLEDATDRIRYFGLFHNRDDLRVDAYSALEIALAVVAQYRDIEGALWGPEQGWADPLAIHPFSPSNAKSVSITFTDHSGRIPIQTTDPLLLRALFQQLGFSMTDAEALADGLLDWTDEDDLRRLNGFDGDDYLSFDPAYLPANRPVESWDEFRLIEPFRTLFWDEEGIPQPAWEQFRSAVSLYSKGPININSAPAIVRETLIELGLLNGFAFTDFLSGPDGIQGTEDDRLARNNDRGFIAAESGSNLGTEIEMLGVRVVASRGDARFQVDALVEWSGANPAGGRDTTQQEPDAAEDAAPDANSQAANARASVNTMPAAAADLGYPFRFIRLIENGNF